MEKTEEYKRTDDRARLLTKLSVISGIGALILLIAALTLASNRGGDVLALAAIPYALAVLFALTSFIYGVLDGSVQREEEEKRLLARRMESRALNVEEDVRFSAGRSFANYIKFSPFVIAVTAVVVIGLMLWQNVSAWSLREGIGVNMEGSPIHTALIATVLMMVSVFSGAFTIGQSRMPGFRWLRPVGAWMMMGFLTLCAAAVSALCFSNNITWVDPLLAKIFFWIFVVLGAEFIINFVIEFYRPRTLGESRPVFESQLLALFTEPGGVLRNIASALDYQFGFKVSGTWIYGFIEKSFLPVLILWAVLVWGFTMMHEVGPNNVGIRERFGKVVSEELLEPGIYWTLPYPFGTIRQYSCSEVRQLIIGESPEGAEERGNSPVILWTNSHGGAKEPFLLAVKESSKNSESQKNATVSSAGISFVNMAIPIEYRIRRDGVMKFVYGNAAPELMLKKLGEQVVVETLAGLTMEELLSGGRNDSETNFRRRIMEIAAGCKDEALCKELTEVAQNSPAAEMRQDLLKIADSVKIAGIQAEIRNAAEHQYPGVDVLRTQLQKLADQNGLGVEIIRVAVMDAHPPVEKVAPAYQNVVASLEEMETERLKAKAYEFTIIPEAEARAFEIEEYAEAAKYAKKTIAEAESRRFADQLNAFNSMKSMFMLNALMDVWETEGAAVRKFVVPSDLKEPVYQMNFETSERMDLIDLDVSELSDNK